MSQRPPKKSRKNPPKNTRRQAPTTAPQAKTTAKATDAEGSAEPQATRASLNAERRNARRAEAEKKAKQKRQLQILGGAVAVAVVVAVLMILVNRPSNSGLDINYDGLAFAPPPITATAGTPAATPEGKSSQDPYIGARLGNPDAPVTLVIYADYQCPYCRMFASETEPKIIDDFVKPGKVRLEFREFPVLGGPDITSKGNESSLSAQAALCAGEQGKYLEYHDKLYANQKGENQGNFSEKRLKQFADELGLDTGAFGTCIDSGRYIAALQQSKAEGQAAGITATPMFVIENGKESSGPIQMTNQGYDLLKKQIETAIETAK